MAANDNNQNENLKVLSGGIILVGLLFLFIGFIFTIGYLLKEGGIYTYMTVAVIGLLLVVFGLSVSKSDPSIDEEKHARKPAEQKTKPPRSKINYDKHV